MRKFHAFTDLWHSYHCWSGRAAFEYFLGQDSTYLRAFAKAYGLLLAQPELDAEAATCVRDLLQGVHDELAHLSDLAKVMLATCWCMSTCTAALLSPINKSHGVLNCIANLLTCLM